MSTLQQPENHSNPSMSPSMAQVQKPRKVSASGLERGDGGTDAVGMCLAVFWTFLAVMFFPIGLCICFNTVYEYERAVIFRQGRIRGGGARGPGIFFILPCIDEFRRIDLRIATYDVPPQIILTKDSVTMAVDAVMYYKVFNPVTAVANVGNYDNSTRLLAAATLRNMLSSRSLHEILADREGIANDMRESLDEATDPWGIKVERVELKTVALPASLQAAMAAEAQASREANAKVIAAEGEMKASQALKDASNVMVGSPAALQLRYLQTLNAISAQRRSTIYFPIPMDLLGSFNRR